MGEEPGETRQKERAVGDVVELEILFMQLFPERGTRGGMFTLNEIALVLSEAYGRRVSYRCVHRAFVWLRKNPHTRDDVEPLPRNERELQFPALAARRIARRVVNSKLPSKYKQTIALTKKIQKLSAS